MTRIVPFRPDRMAASLAALPTSAAQTSSSAGIAVVLCLALVPCATGCRPAESAATAAAHTADASASPVRDGAQAIVGAPAHDGAARSHDAAPAEPALETQIADVASGVSSEIVLGHTPVTDDDLARLTNLTGLEVLRLAQGTISDEGAAHLAKLENLRQLVLGPTTLSDAGLRRLAACRQLETLNIQEADVTDEGLACLADLPRLTLLRLGCPRITDAGLAQIGRLEQLRWLILRDAAISDAGLPHLYGLSHLESFYISGTNVTDAGIAELHRVLPELHVHW